MCLTGLHILYFRTCVLLCQQNSRRSAIAVMPMVLLVGLLLLRLIFRLATGLLHLGRSWIVLLVLGMLILSWTLGL